MANMQTMAVGKRAAGVSKQEEYRDAVFSSAGQAVHVAYMIMAQEAQQDAPLRKALMRIMESAGSLAEPQREWLEQLRGSTSKQVNFAGLSPLEVRAQCALIVHAVAHKLPRTEMWALQAKYGHTDMEDAAGVRRYAFSAERIAAIKGLADWMAPAFPAIQPFALDCMVGKLYANHQGIAISFRELAKSFGGNHMTYARNFDKLKQRLHELEMVALDRLEPYLREQGVVGEVFC
ncbi:hypothetical protein [Rugamonas violacea]|uniref:hypothetical protein n=2 Tax=Rugamonas sp. CCM 8940 TaxID=2765359 RepID=UPI0036711278